VGSGSPLPTLLADRKRRKGTRELPEREDAAPCRASAAVEDSLSERRGRGMTTPPTPRLLSTCDLGATRNRPGRFVTGQYATKNRETTMKDVLAS